MAAEADEPFQNGVMQTARAVAAARPDTLAALPAIRTGNIKPGPTAFAIISSPGVQMLAFRAKHRPVFSLALRCDFRRARVHLL